MEDDIQMVSITSVIVKLHFKLKLNYTNTGIEEQRVDAEQRENICGEEEKRPRGLQSLRQREAVDERHSGRQVLLRPAERTRCVHYRQGTEYALGEFCF